MAVLHRVAPGVFPLDVGSHNRRTVWRRYRPNLLGYSSLVFTKVRFSLWGRMSMSSCFHSRPDWHRFNSGRAHLPSGWVQPSPPITTNWACVDERAKVLPLSMRIYTLTWCVWYGVNQPQSGFLRPSESIFRKRDESRCFCVWYTVQRHFRRHPPFASFHEPVWYSSEHRWSFQWFTLFSYGRKTIAVYYSNWKSITYW